MNIGQNNSIYNSRTSDVSPNYTEWPTNVNSIRYLSSADNTLQPAMFYYPPGDKPKPLLVGLHTWSGDYNQSGFGSPYAHWCIDNNWAFIHPDFRGTNNKPEAAGSEMAVQDIVSSVNFAKKQTNIDITRIYLIGVSGGGHASLLMAGRYPEIWAAVSVWVPILDLQAWFHECKAKGNGYAEQIVNFCGGEPIKGSEAITQYAKRSPLTYLDNAKNIFIDINAGIHDGHKGSVYISHSLKAYNILADEKDHIPQTYVDYFVENEKVPPELACNVDDRLYGNKRVLFRRNSGKTRITVFDGGHEILYLPALKWLATKVKK